MNLRHLRSNSDYFILFAVQVVLFGLFWDHSIHVLIDSFNDYWIAGEISKGKFLYKDLFFQYGPLVPHVLSLLLGLSSNDLDVLILCSFLTILSFQILFLKISTIYIQSSLRLVPPIFYLVSVAFQTRPKFFNYVFPYSWSTEFFTLCLLAIIYSFQKLYLTGRSKYLYLTLISCFCSFLIRPIFSIAPVAFTLMGLIVFFRYAKVPKPKAFLPAFLVFSGAMISFYPVYLWGIDGFTGFFNCLIRHASIASESPFHLNIVSGYNDIPGNLLMSSVDLLALACPILIVRFWHSRFRYLVLIGSVAVCYVSYSQASNFYGLVLFAVSILSIDIVRFLRNKENPRHPELTFMCVVSLSAALRVLVKPEITTFGSFFLLPLLLFYLVCSLMFLDKASSKVALLLAVLFMFSSTAHVNRDTVGNFLSSKFSIEIKGHSFFLPGPAHLKSIEQITEFLEKSPAGDLVAFPEGILLNILSNRENPVGISSFLPTHIAALGSQNIVRRLGSTNPRYIAITSRGIPEYGYTGLFGENYGQDIKGWIDDHYTPILVAGNRRPFQIYLFENDQRANE